MPTSLVPPTKIVQLTNNIATKVNARAMSAKHSMIAPIFNIPIAMQEFAKIASIYQAVFTVALQTKTVPNFWLFVPTWYVLRDFPVRPKQTA